MKNRALYNWLEYQWRMSNHSKYQHLFKEWVKNITQNQIEGFEKQMNTEINR